MTAHRSNPIVVGVTIEERNDGGIRVSSRDLRGLHLSGADRDHIWCMLPAAITSLLERNHGVKVVSVRASKTPEEAFQNLPHVVDMHVERQFVVELADAA
ncbi:hypothetical protein [Brevundimonas sp. 'scallop']|uniref:hypothetical protein n=1 Tax=Brevundimonas sp. 'scallop' TaxID=2562582 RepID=UPI0013E0FF0C|nr:hypothetical protein [Brevundimonas sp. 'scallop']QIF81902.1 hypothetical protein E4341_09430 [Brevundimonas sp. 'scallop']